MHLPTNSGYSFEQKAWVGLEPDRYAWTAASTVSEAARWSRRAAARPCRSDSAFVS